MNLKSLSLTLVVFGFAVLAGQSHAQQDLKPLQADVDNLKQQLSRLQGELSPARSSSSTPMPPMSASRLLFSCMSSGGSFVATTSAWACSDPAGNVVVCTARSCGSLSKVNNRPGRAG